jgi:hypothetical protein
MGPARAGFTVRTVPNLHVSERRPNPSSCLLRSSFQKYDPETVSLVSLRIQDLANIQALGRTVLNEGREALQVKSRQNPTIRSERDVCITIALLKPPPLAKRSAL